MTNAKSPVAAHKGKGKNIVICLTVRAVSLLLIATSAQQSPPTETNAQPAHQTAGADKPPPPSGPVAPRFPYSVMRGIRDWKDHSGYLTSILELRARKGEVPADAMSQQLYLDVLGFFLPLVSLHEEAFRVESEFRNILQHPAEARSKKSTLGGFHPQPAVEAVLKAAADRSVIMFNEEHRSSIQRAFVTQLLPGLREEGFTHLALEALGFDDKGINARGHAIFSDGVYFLDPCYGQLVRQARALGFTIVAYEDETAFTEGSADPVERENRREAGAAKNLNERVLAKDPQARLIVYAGRGHIHENPADDWIPMAARLKKSTGIDPLTVDLTKMVESHDPKYEYNDYINATEAGLLKDKPVVMISDDGKFFSREAGYDIQVFFPRAKYPDGRADYLAMGGLRKQVRHQFDTSKLAGPALLQALVPGESPTAIPADQVLLEPGKPTPPLWLPKGRFIVRVIDASNAELDRKEIAVD